MTNRKYPLEGLKVVELATVVAAPTAGRLLSDFGADVIKVESKGGDLLRGVGVGLALPMEEDNNPIFDIFNSGKRLVSINLKTDGGMRLMKELLAQADIFISNVRMPSLKKMKLDYDSIKEEFPELVYGHFSGFGLEGEGAGDPGFDTTAFWVRSGAMLDGVVDGDFPYRPSYGFGDIATSGYFLSGMLMALRARDQGMGGSFVSTSLMSAGMWHNIAHLVNSQEKYGRKYPLERYEPWSPTVDYYMCKDEKWLCVAGKYYPDDRPVFAELMDMPELMTDPDLASLDKMSASGKTSQVARKIQEKMKEKASDEWIKIFKERDIPVEPMGHFKDAVYDPQAAANGYVEEFDYGDGEPTKIPVPPMKICGFDRKPFAQEGKVGAQSAEVLKELGYSDEEIEKFRKEGYID